MKISASRLFALLSALAMLGASSPTLLAEAPPALLERQQRIQQVAREVAPAVVAIVTDFENENRNRAEMGSGSGVIVSADGLILTAAHVVQAVGDEFTVILSTGVRANAKALGKNFSRDSALAKITTPGTYPHVSRAAADALTEGEWCVAFGHPGGYEVDRAAPLRLGRVLEKDVDGFIVSDCTLSGGDSGGPLFNLEGKLIGIHSSIGWRVEENRHVPMAAFEKDWDRLMNGEAWGRLGQVEREPRRRQRAEPQLAAQPEPDQAALGVTVVTSYEQPGAIVSAVAAKSPARTAGVEAGDIITKINGKSVADSEELGLSVRSCKPGEEITLTIQRNGRSQDLKIKLIAAKELGDDE